MNPRTLGLVVLAHAVGLGCALIHGTAKPAAYGVELTACEDRSSSRAEYVPCCVDTARRYQRDAGFCYGDDGGAP